jgi:hypothetical protein
LTVPVNRLMPVLSGSMYRWMQLHRRMAAVCLSIGWLALLLGTSAAHAAEALEIRSPYINVVSGVYALNAQLQFNVPEQVEHAVRDGATLSLELQIRLSRSRNWWRDEVLAQLQQRYELLYHGVSERYLVRNVNSGAQSSYATFEQAVASLQQVESLPVPIRHCWSQIPATRSTFVQRSKRAVFRAHWVCCFFGWITSPWKVTGTHGQ